MIQTTRAMPTKTSMVRPSTSKSCLQHRSYNGLDKVIRHVRSRFKETSRSLVFHFLFAAAARRRETLTTNRISSPINPRHICMFLVSHEFLCRLTFLYLYTFSSCKNKCTSPSFRNGSFVKSTRTNSRYFSSIGKIQCLVDNACSQIGRTIQCFSMRTNAR